MKTTLTNTNVTNTTIQNDSLQRLRNIGIAAHVDAGKTTLTERLLFLSGAIHAAGNVDDGNTTTDSDPIEQKKGITIKAAAVSTQWTPAGGLWEGVPHRINVIDTPGHVDFTAEVERSMRVLDGAIAVFCAVGGVQPQSERVWRQAERYGVPRLAFVNKMDRAGADFAGVLEQIRGKLGANAWPVAVPLGAEGGLRGVIDVVDQRAVIYGDKGAFAVEHIPPGKAAQAAELRQKLVEALAELDEAIAARFLAEEPVSGAELKAAIRRQTVTNRFVPVLAGSAYRWCGVQTLLDAVVDYLPSPAEIPAAPGLDPDAPEREVTVKPDDPPCALVFKLWTDAYNRRLAFIRVYAGSLRQGDSVLNTATGQVERIQRLVRIMADRQVEVDSVGAGEIAGILGLKRVATGHTLSDPRRPVLLEAPRFPEPIVTMALEPADRASRDKLGLALQRLMEEDPTFRVTTDVETGQTIMAGMGELHLEIKREVLASEHGVQTEAGAPRIAYRETATRAARGEFQLRKQEGGNGQYAHVILELRPGKAGGGNVVNDRVIGGAIPREFRPACRKGVLDALETGILGGYPVVDVEVDLVDGSFHNVDSSDLAFRTAASMAVKDALARSSPALLEPIMQLEVMTPAEHQGDLMGDIARRRGQVTGSVQGPVETVLRADVPLAEMFGYANTVRSLSKGRAEYSLTPSRLEIVPAAITKAVLSKS
jgi:elongation factor G